MVKKHMGKIVGILCLLLLAGSLPGTLQIQKMKEKKTLHNLRGLDQFKTGFYTLTPQHRTDEAAFCYARAIREFKQALASDPDYRDAHRNLGRVYFVSGKYLKSAEHYTKLTEIDPTDIDAYALTALAYTEADRFEEARAILDAAMEHTADVLVQQKLLAMLLRLKEGGK